MPKFSIVTICYNEPQLERTCDSIVNQTYQDFEWIVIDGASNAETLAIFDKYKSRINYFVSEKDNGIYDALNKGIKVAKGEYVIFMNAGDKFVENDVLELVADDIAKNGAEDVVYGYVRLDGNTIMSGTEHKVHHTKFYQDPNLWRYTGLPHQACFIRRSIFDEMGGYDTTYKIYADRAHFIKLFQAGKTFRFTNTLVAVFNHEGISASRNKLCGEEMLRIMHEYFPQCEKEFSFKHSKIAQPWFKFIRIFVFPFKPLRHWCRQQYKNARLANTKGKELGRMPPRRNLLFIAHSYHKKTRSCDFMIELLGRSYNIDVHYDDSWETGVFNTKIIKNGKYETIVFWQNIPNPKQIRKIKHKNMIWFPMHDGIESWKPKRLRSYHRLKVINFCRADNRMFKKFRFDSTYVQYYPKPGKFIPGNSNTVFFWQRTNNIDINKVAAVLPENVQIHMHKAIDPHCTFIDPTPEQIEKHKITFSEWFDTKQEMTDFMNSKQVYIAPRYSEGIGMSFLEAMATGKAIIAHDAPTMNEYIKDGKTGYLVDFENPKPIDLSNIADVQKNTYDSVVAGYKKWVDSQQKIRNLINRKPRLIKTLYRRIKLMFA